MSFLDELKKDAELALRDSDASAARNAELQAIYRDQLLPAMLAIHRYLLDLVQQLETVSWKVTGAFVFPGIGVVKDLEQQGYRAHIDSSQSPMRINLSFFCKAKDEQRYSCNPEDADALQKFLLAQKVQAVTWPKRLPGGKHYIMCEARLAVACNMRFEVNIEQSSIELDLSNLRDASHQTLSFSKETVSNEAWLNSVGGYILRKIDTLEVKETLSDEDRAKVQNQIDDLQRRKEKAEQQVKTAVKIGALGREEEARKRIEVLEKLQAKLQERLDQG